MPEIDIFGIKGKGEKIFIILDASGDMMVDEIGGIYATIAEEGIHIVEFLSEVGGLLKYSGDPIFVESCIIIDGWVALGIEGDVDISQSTMIEHGGIMGLVTTFVGLEGNDDISRPFATTLGS